MTIETKGRSELKSYFMRNAIPTEANFNALIDAPLNQADDGVFKRGGEPLSVVASPGERQPTLRLYDTYPKQAPSWTISLKPSQSPNDASTAREGFGIVDGEGNTRLFIDRQSGALGLGVNAPQGMVDVMIPGAHGSWNRFVVAGATDWGNGNAHVTIGTGTQGIMFRNPHVSWIAEEARASIRYGLSGGTSNGRYWDVGIRADSKFTFAFHGADAHRLSLDANGNLVATGKVSAANLETSGKVSTGVLEASGKASAASIETSGKVSAASIETSGTVMSTGLIFEAQASAHIERDGSLYRTGGQVYLTVDDNLYVRKKGGDWAARFLTTDGSLTVKGKIDSSGELSIGGDGKENGPDGSMHITNDCILFGGNNSGKQADSAQISAGKHATNELCIVGMSSGTGAQDRKIRMWAEGGLTVSGSSNTWTVTMDGKKLYFALATSTHGGGSVRTISWDGDSNWDQSSDARLKTNIEPEEQILPRLLQLPVKRYQWVDGGGQDPEKIGFLAQDVQSLFPELVGCNTNPETQEQTLTLKYANFGVLAIGGLRELKAQTDATIAEQSALIERLQERLASLEAIARS